MSTPMTYGRHLRAILILGLPLAGSQLAQMSLSLVDAAMLGWYDPTTLAAETLSMALFTVLFLAGSGFAAALAPLVAAAEGKGDTTQARRLTRMTLWLSALAGVVILPILLSAEAIFLALGQTPALSALAGEYLDILAWGIFPALGAMVLKSYLAALERTNVVLGVMLVAVVVNAIANYALIFGAWGFPEMGIRGAALSSLLMHIFTLVFLVIYIQRTLPEQSLFQRLWKGDSESLGQVFRLGWPIGLTLVAEVGLFSASSVLMGWLGELPLVAHGIAIQITSMIFMVHLGLSQAVTIRAGRAQGQGDMVSFRRGAHMALVLALAIVGLSLLAFLTIPDAMIAVFLSPDDPAREEILAVGRGLLYAAAVFQLADAMQVLALGLLRGLQDTRRPMIFAAISYWVVGVPAAWVLGFPLGFGGVGIWLGLAAGLSLAAVTMMTRLWRTVVPQADAEVAARAA
ncbi:MATE family efflux transporter [Pseudooceanicola marinus]|nr:MATE family efflux transporter [Pseudooceanicola marinus]PJE32426.1 MATE family efflux transporter [Pseudooceanicola marinus]